MGRAPVSKVGDLIPNKLAFEESAAAGMSDDLPVPIAQALDPLRTPARFIPWLGAGRGVDLWFEDWPEARKRQIVAQWPQLAALIGTREGARRMLEFVDAELIDAVAYPQRHVLARAVVGRTPIGHQPYVVRYLVRVRTFKPKGAMALGRGALGRKRIRTPSREQLQRVLAALRIAKSPETQVRVDFQHLRPLNITDAPALDEHFRLDQWVARTKL